MEAALSVSLPLLGGTCITCAHTRLARKTDRTGNYRGAKGYLGSNDITIGGSFLYSKMENDFE